MPASPMLPLSVSAAGFERRDGIAETALNLTALLARETPRVPMDPRWLRLSEVDVDGAVVNPSVPMQFDPCADWHPLWSARGLLTFALDGVTPAGTTRRFRLHLRGEPAVPDGDPARRLGVKECFVHGSPHLEIAGKNATWLFDLTGGGFSELRDADGRDWIQFDNAGPPIEYRGIPNLQMYLGPGSYKGVFHPGYGSVNCRVEASGPLAVRIRCTTFVHAEWECLWEVFPRFARCTVLRGAAQGFAFLYEGVPGGRDFRGDTAYIVESDGTKSHFRPSNNTVLWEHNISPKWVYFGDERCERTLFYAHHEEDGIAEAMYEVFDALTVWGFGRNQMPGVHRFPARFSVGLCESREFDTVRHDVESAFRDLEIGVGVPAYS